ncbi:unnamed protein product [Effrenium voratum]|nr:unnamed protein product [Effrenium voratum]
MSAETVPSFQFKHVFMPVPQPAEGGKLAELAKAVSTTYEAAMLKLAGIRRGTSRLVAFTGTWVLVVPLNPPQPGTPEHEVWLRLPPLNPCGLCGVVICPLLEQGFPETAGGTLAGQRLVSSRAEEEGIPEDAAEYEAARKEVRISSQIYERHSEITAGTWGRSAVYQVVDLKGNRGPPGLPHPAKDDDDDDDDDDDGAHFVELRGLRCVELPQHPLGEAGGTWSDGLEQAARDACDDTPGCAGFMRYVGDNEQHCFDWCGRPQFCMAAEQEPPLHGNAAWTSYVKSEYLDALGLRSQLVDWFPPQPKKPLEGELAREIDCASTGFGQSSDPPVMLLAPARVEALNGSDPLPEACRVLYLPAGAQLAGEAHVHGVLSEDEDALLPVFSATAPDQDFAPGTAKSRRYFFDAVPELPTDVAFKKKYVLSIYFLSPDSFCAGPNETQLSPEMVKADIAPQHVYVEDGTHQTREAAFKHYHFTMFCGDFSKEPFPPLALIYSLAYVAHAMVPEFLHWKGSRMFFHLPDASQGVRSTRILGLEAYLQSLMTSPSKEKVMEFKETFTLLCQVLFRYRYAEPAPRRAQVAACGLCDAKAREERRAIARGDEAVAVVFCVMSRRSAHELRQVVRETWGKGLAGKAPAVVQRFFVGQAANESHVLQDRDQGDVVELPVKESYRTLNLKALAMLSWAHERFPNLQWLVRHDDDVYLRAPALLAQLASRPPVRYLWGMFDHGSSPVRDPAHQHYNSFEQFPKQDHPAWGDIFPPYARGLLWAMSADLVAATVREFREDLQEQPDIPLDEEAANRLPHPDDPAVGVLIAGLVRQGMSINLDDRDFNSFSLNPSCNSTFSNIHNRTWVVHHVKPETMRCMWDLDTAESAVGISDQNSVIDASSRIFPDLCRCSTEVVEEEDGEEEPFWYDKSRFNNAR